MVTRRDYPEDMVAAANSVLIEVIHALGSYRSQIVVVGGSVPQLLFRDGTHPGTTDIDLAINHREIGDQEYQTIEALLLERGYTKTNTPHQLERTVRVGGNEFKIKLDFITGEYGGTGKSHRHQRVQNTLLIRKARGCDLVFESPQKVRIEGELPDGGKDSVEVQVADIPSFFIMKSMAMKDRLKEKDSYDVYYCLDKCRDNLDTLVEEFRPRLNYGLVKEGLQKLREHFVRCR